MIDPMTLEEKQRDRAKLLVENQRAIIENSDSIAFVLDDLIEEKVGINEDKLLSSLRVAFAPDLPEDTLEQIPGVFLNFLLAMGEISKNMLKEENADPELIEILGEFRSKYFTSLNHFQNKRQIGHDTLTDISTDIKVKEEGWISFTHHVTTGYENEFSFSAGHPGHLQVVNHMIRQSIRIIQLFGDDSLTGTTNQFESLGENVNTLFEKVPEEYQ